MAMFPKNTIGTPPSFLPPRPPASLISPPPMQAQPLAEQRTLIVGRGISLQGDIKNAERLVVEGTVQSDLITAVDLTIAEGGLFKGAVQVERAVVSGAFDGDLSATGELLVSRTGHLTGTARYHRMVVENGGKINGNLETLT
jgi:cytoskeletal protein CcmA (bactofilin family)